MGRGAAFFFRATAVAGAGAGAVAPACASESAESAEQPIAADGSVADGGPRPDANLPRGTGGRGSLPDVHVPSELDVYVGPAADAYGVAADVQAGPMDVYTGVGAEAYGVAPEALPPESDGGGDGSSDASSDGSDGLP
jgi:hypothetical protein